MLAHQAIDRRRWIQAGASSILGLGMSHLGKLQAEGAKQPIRGSFGRAKSCIFIFLSGGLSQHDSFDMKPQAEDKIRGEFHPIATATPGLQICEHLPMLAQRSQRWGLLRSLTHPSNDHSAGHHIMLTGRSSLPTGFNPSAPTRLDEPSIAAIAGVQLSAPNNLPTAVCLPESLVHSTGRVIPGQNAGQMGPQHDPWLLQASPFDNQSYGAFPEYSFDHQQRGKPDPRVFGVPQLGLGSDWATGRLADRLGLLQSLNHRKDQIERLSSNQSLDRYRAQALTLLTDPKLQRALSISQADPKQMERYGNNSFGWSLWIARQLVGMGIPMIQVQLGNNETWDTHGNAFPHLKDKLFPPTDRALSALLDDLQESGLLDETLVVVAGEFGRTPQITLLEQHYKLPGRDHWGAVQSVLFAGGGTAGGAVVGKSDPRGAYPEELPVTPERFAATIYHLLGIPASAHWMDASQRPHAIYHGEPITELFA